MIVEFNKVNDSEFLVTKDRVKFHGILKKENKNLVKCMANIKGEISHFCDICAKDLELKINEDLEIYISNGIFKDNIEFSLDVYEIQDGKIDLNEILNSEIVCFLSEYFYCDNCKGE